MRRLRSSVRDLCRLLQQSTLRTQREWHPAPDLRGNFLHALRWGMYDGRGLLHRLAMQYRAGCIRWHLRELISHLRSANQMIPIHNGNISYAVQISG